MTAALSDFLLLFSFVTCSAYHHAQAHCAIAGFDLAFTCLYYQSAGWSSLVARWAHNPKVGGSNPPPATKPSQNNFFQFTLFEPSKDFSLLIGEVGAV